jgi:hypothetical protein
MGEVHSGRGMPRSPACRSFLPERIFAARRTSGETIYTAGRFWRFFCTQVAACREVLSGRQDLPRLRSGGQDLPCFTFAPIHEGGSVLKDPRLWSFRPLTNTSLKMGDSAALMPVSMVKMRLVRDLRAIDIQTTSFRVTQVFARSLFRMS